MFGADVNVFDAADVELPVVACTVVELQDSDIDVSMELVGASSLPLLVGVTISGVTMSSDVTTTITGGSVDIATGNTEVAAALFCDCGLAAPSLVMSCPGGLNGDEEAAAGVDVVVGGSEKLAVSEIVVASLEAGVDAGLELEDAAENEVLDSA